MRFRLRAILGFLVIGLATGASAGDSSDVLGKEVEAFGDRLAAAMLDNDIELMLGMYAEDAISLPNYGLRMQGIEAFRRSHDSMAVAGMKIRSFESQPTEAWEGGNQVIEIGNCTIALDMPGMPNIEDTGKYLTIYLREKDGSLKVKVETWNTDMDPMAMGAGGHDHGDQ